MWLLIGIECLLVDYTPCVLSYYPDANKLSWLKATELTGPICPCKLYANSNSIKKQHFVLSFYFLQRKYKKSVRNLMKI